VWKYSYGYDRGGSGNYWPIDQVFVVARKK
jgi:hypothetical protein